MLVALTKQNMTKNMDGISKFTVCKLQFVLRLMESLNFMFK